MNKIKQAVLAGMVLAAMGAGDALAHDNDRDCFSYRSGPGSIEICSALEGRHSHYNRDHDDDHDRHYDRDNHKREYYHPVFYGPPGHHKERWHHKYRKPYNYYVYKGGHWWVF